MKRINVINLLVCMLMFCVCQYPTQPKEKRLIDYVDPIIGSDGHGHVFVGANIPFGAVQLGPNNFYKGWDWSSGYHYSDSIIKGFSHLNLSGTGATDLGDILTIPVIGALKVNSGTQSDHLSGYASKFSHKNELVQPGYYSVMLERYNILVELTSSARVGFHKYTYPESNTSRIIIDLEEGNADEAFNTSITKIDSVTIVGYRYSNGWSKDQRVYFAAKVSKPFDELLIFNGNEQVEDDSAQGVAVKAVLNYKTQKDAEILMKIGLSPVSTKNALLNIDSEIPSWNFEQVKTRAQSEWENELTKIKIEASETEKRVFYTALYHTMISPVLYNDVNMDYLGADKKVYTNVHFNNYSVFSLWDTYRALHPLYTITQPERIHDLIKTMLVIYEQTGKLPEWHLMGYENSIMIGYSAISVIADAYLKGFNGFDAEYAYQACKATAMRDDDGIGYIKELNYIPSDSQHESVAKALEYAISDWGLAMMAKSLNKNTDYEYFLKRSKLYMLYFDSKLKYFRGKMADGNWREPFDPLESKHRDDDYCEGNAWQYLWLVPHDVEGLIELFGSDDLFNEKLDDLFSLDKNLGKCASPDISGLIGQYAHGNEPSHHITYLYAYGGQQWKTAEKVRYIMRELYKDAPNGLTGNEDCGQMSAWYVFSALGFYPVNPQNGAYVFGSPMVNKATIKTNTGKELTVESHNNSESNIYINQIKLNGKSYNKSFITHKLIQEGGHLEYFMDSVPNKSFGAKAKERPLSIIY